MTFYSNRFVSQGDFDVDDLNISNDLTYVN